MSRAKAQRRKEVRKQRALLKALRAGRAKPENQMARAPVRFSEPTPDKCASLHTIVYLTGQAG